MTFKAKIDEMNLMGNGITKLDGCVVFCLGAVDGDSVTCEITQSKKNFKIANVLSVDEPSPHRQEVDSFSGTARLVRSCVWSPLVRME